MIMSLLRADQVSAEQRRDAMRNADNWRLLRTGTGRSVPGKAAIKRQGWWRSLINAIRYRLALRRQMSALVRETRPETGLEGAD